MQTKTNSISEVPPPPESGDRLRAAVPDSLREGLHALMLAASQGDRRAIGAIAIAFLPALVGTAQSEIDRTPFPKERPPAADIVSEVLEAMASGALAPFPPAPGEGLEWLESTVRRCARGRAMCDPAGAPDA